LNAYGFNPFKKSEQKGYKNNPCILEVLENRLWTFIQKTRENDLKDKNFQ